QGRELGVEGEAALEGVEMLVDLDAAVPEPAPGADPRAEGLFLGPVRIEPEDGRLPDRLRPLLDVGQGREGGNDREVAPARRPDAVELHATSSRYPSGPAERPESASMSLSI